MSAKYEIGSKLKVVVGDCESAVTIHARWYDTIKDTWIYRINGKGNCGSCIEQVSEEYLMEHSSNL